MKETSDTVKRETETNELLLKEFQGNGSGVSESVETGDGRSGKVGEEVAGSDEDVEIQAFLDIADDDDVVRDWSRTAGVSLRMSWMQRLATKVLELMIG